MAKKKEWNTNVKAPKKRFTTAELVIYGIIIVIALILCILLGGAMDASSANGKVDITQLSQGFHVALQHPFQLLKRIADKESNVSKMLVLGMIAIGLIIAYQFTQEPKRLHRKGQEYGSARWGTKKDAKRLIDPAEPDQHIMINPDTGERLTDDEGNYLCYWCDNNSSLSGEIKMSMTPWKLALNDPSKKLNLNLNVIVLGTSGSGKTRYIVLPNACQLNTSYVFTDPKGEILRDTAKMFREAGYKIKIFNLIDMRHSNNYNPFEYVYDDQGAVLPEKVQIMTKVLFNAMKGEGEKEDFWSKKGEQVLQSCIFLVYEQSEYDLPLLEDGTPDYSKRDHSLLNFASIAEKLRDLQYPPKGSKKPDGFFLKKNEDESDEAFQQRLKESFLCPLDKEFMELQKRKPDTLAYQLYKEIRNAPEETGQSFLSSANVKTFPFNFPAVRDLTCCDNIHLETLGDEKTVLYIITSATTSTFDFLTTMMYSQLFDTLSNRANFKYSGSLPVHVRFIMDEFANLGEIPNFERIIAYVRSMGMSLVVILQTLSQLKTHYEKSFETITGNCSTQVFLGGAEESTTKSISERLGKETIDIRGRNRTLGRNRSTSENNSIVGRELMQQSEIAEMPSSDCIVMVTGLPPFYCTKYPLEEHPNYKFLGNADPQRRYKHTELKTITLAEFKASQRKQKDAAKEAAEKRASITLAEEQQEQSDVVQKNLDSAYSKVDLLKLLQFPPKLHIEEKYVDAPKEVFGDPMAIPVDIDPNLLYPDIHRKEKIANDNRSSTVKESIDFEPIANPVSEEIADPVISFTEKPEVQTADDAEQAAPVEEVAASSNSEPADENVQSTPQIGVPIQESISPEVQEVPVEETFLVTHEVQDVPDMDVFLENSFENSYAEGDYTV